LKAAIILGRQRSVLQGCEVSLYIVHNNQDWNMDLYLSYSI
jgi:hypothetical protein